MDGIVEQDVNLYHMYHVTFPNKNLTKQLAPKIDFRDLFFISAIFAALTATCP